MGSRGRFAICISSIGFLLAANVGAMASKTNYARAIKSRAEFAADRLSTEYDVSAERELLARGGLAQFWASSLAAIGTVLWIVALIASKSRPWSAQATLTDVPIALIIMFVLISAVIV